MIRFNRVSHSGFGTAVGLRNLSFHISAGEPGAVIGAVGSGHDLIMRMCSLEREPQEGKVLLDGIDTRGLGGRQRRQLRLNTGIVSRDLPLLGDRSVLENVVLALEIRGWSRRRAVRRALKALESAGVLELKGANPRALPDEDCAMICLARAIASGPRLMLANRVLEQLQNEKAARMLTVLRDMAALGAAVLLLEHSVNTRDLSGWRCYSLKAGAIESVEIVALSDHTDRSASLVDRLLDSSN
jgi:ABC-type ATPase involved in cell division